MKIYFVTFQDVNMASMRIRAHWVAPHLPGASVVDYRDIPGDGDVYIWCKFGAPAAIQQLPNARHYWDVCDPFWWFEPGHAMTLARMVDGVVASNEALAADFTEWSGLPCGTIPDRLDLTQYPHKAEHGPRDEMKLVWFGYQNNRPAIFNGLVNLERLAMNGHRISLTIMDGAPDAKFDVADVFPIYHLPWTLEDHNEQLSQFDIAFLPPYPGPWGKVKSNNKWLTAWASGLPVTMGAHYDQLEDLVIDHVWRKALAAEGNTWLMRDGNVEKSGREWNDLLSLPR